MAASLGSAIHVMIALRNGCWIGIRDLPVHVVEIDLGAVSAGVFDTVVKKLERARGRQLALAINTPPLPLVCAVNS
jgi:hypothetical protein